MIELQYLSSRLKIDLEHGAAIKYWSFQKNGKTITPIEADGSNAYESSLLFPFPNRLAHGEYEFEGDSFQFPLNDFGKPNALHGFIADLPFQITDESERSVSLKLAYDGKKDEYPFPFDFTVKYVLDENEISINVEVINKGESDMPCGFGWHPYFNAQISEESPRLKLPKVSAVEVDENMIPTGEESRYQKFQDFEPIKGYSLDNCFRLEKIDERMSVFLSYPNVGSLEVWQDVNFPFIQIFKHNEETVAIEPMTCGIDALNTKEGLMILSPDQQWDFKIGIRFY